MSTVNQDHTSTTTPLVAFIASIATSVPAYKISQAQLLDAGKNWAPEEYIPQLRSVYLNSGIEHRHMCIPDYFSSLSDNESDSSCKDKKFLTDKKIPITLRMSKFNEKAAEIAVATSQEVISKAQLNPGNIGKIVLVSSTGFSGPGLDCEIISKVGLSRDIERCIVGFMGCAAAINGIQVAHDYVQTHPSKAALVCCVELSSVHTSVISDVSGIITNAIFSDGCAAIIIASKEKSTLKEKKGCVVLDFASYYIPDTADGIVLGISSDGVTCQLSRNLPLYIEQNLGGFIDKFLSKNGLERNQIQFWAIHPGGKKIIEAAEKSLNLGKEKTLESWNILANFGNMLSPSVLFVIELILKNYFAQDDAANQSPLNTPNYGITFSFSPGVGIEAMLFVLQ